MTESAKSEMRWQRKDLLGIRELGLQIGHRPLMLRELLGQAGDLLLGGGELGLQIGAGALAGGQLLVQIRVGDLARLELLAQQLAEFRRNGHSLYGKHRRRFVPIGCQD